MLDRTKLDDSVLKRISSPVFNSSTPGGREVAKGSIQSKSHSTQTRMKPYLDVEIVPDSEEERRGKENERLRGKELVDIIEISSDEEDKDFAESCKTPSMETEDPFVSKIPGAWTLTEPEFTKPTNVKELLGQDWAPRKSHVISKSKRTYRSRMIIQSSSSEGSNDDRQPPHDRNIIELSDSSPEQSPKVGSRNTTKPIIPVALKTSAFFFDEEDSCSDDGAILTLNEPRSARKPIHLNPRYARSITAIADPTLNSVPPPFRPVKDVLGTPCTPGSPTKAKQVRRTGKKAQAAAEQARRAAYAQLLFTELNQVVFGNGLPQDTKLKWNKRLLTTAGRAKWHRSREGVQTTEIELAEKILDCEERIRNTLSHEMCHLATWIMNANPKEGHGNLWKGWAAKVMRKRPEIIITTRHDYEISHPFEWECENCAKIYGRFSKSIRPDECVCGACKQGKLIPLFSDPKKLPKTPKTSRNASIKPKDSPCSLPRPHVVHQNDTEIETGHPGLHDPGHYPVYTVHDSDSESDSGIQILTTAMGSVTLLASKTS